MYIVFGSNIASSIPDGDKGDVTISGGTWVVDNDVVSDAKLAEMAAQALKANPTGSTANPQDLTISEQRVVGRITGGNLTGLTATQIRTLINVEDGATADQTGSEIETLLDAELGGTTWKQGIINLDGTLYRTSSDGSVEVYIPASNTAAARGDAAVLALADLVTGDTIVFAKGFVYDFDTEVTVTVASGVFATIDFNGATLRREAGTQSDWIFAVDVDAGSILTLKNGYFDGNRDNCTIVSPNRGENVRIDGDGYVYSENLVSFNCPVDSGIDDDAAVGFFVRGGGHKKLVNCLAYNPSYANYRLQATSMEFIGCDSLNMDHSGNKGRLWVMDASFVARCSIIGGVWQTAEAYEVNSNFDPYIYDPGNPGAPVYYCDDIVIDGVYMDFGTSHTNISGDSFLKFDDCRKVRILNCTQRNSILDTVYEEDQAPNTYRYETWISINYVRSFIMDNCVADATCKFTSPTSVVYCERAVFQNCEFGYNSFNGHAISNLGHCGDLTVRNCRFHNLMGVSTGTFRAIFPNTNFTHSLATADPDHYLTVENCYFQTDFADNGVFVNTCPALGSIAIGNVVVEDIGSPTYLASSSLTRLLASVLPGDRKVAYLTRDMLGRGTQYTLGSGTYADNHMSPEDPGIDDDDWFGNLIPAFPGSRIVNENAGAGGNGFPNHWIMNESGNFVEDPNVTLY